jgi:hypothetical protein
MRLAYGWEKKSQPSDGTGKGYRNAVAFPYMIGIQPQNFGNLHSASLKSKAIVNGRMPLSTLADLPAFLLGEFLAEQPLENK